MKDERISRRGLEREEYFPTVFSISVNLIITRHSYYLYSYTLITPFTNINTSGSLYITEMIRYKYPYILTKGTPNG